MGGDGEGQDPVETDRRENDGNAAEEKEKHHQDALPGKRVRNPLAHGSRIVDGDLGVECFDRLAHAGSEAKGPARAMRHTVERAARVGLVGEEDRHTWVGAEAVVLHVLDHA